MANYERRSTRQIHIGTIPIGGGAPISVQSMCNTKTTDTEAIVQQIRELAAAGCDIVRVAVPDMEAAKNLGNIVRQVKTPLVADIHFDYKLALEAMAQGVAALLSLNLAIINLLPVPALDGGHFLTLCVEAVRGKPLSPKVMHYVQNAGVGLIVLLMLLAMKNDVMRIFAGG